MHFQQLSINGHFTVITGLKGKKKDALGIFFNRYTRLFFMLVQAAF